MESGLLLGVVVRVRPSSSCLPAKLLRCNGLVVHFARDRVSVIGFASRVGDLRSEPHYSRSIHPNDLNTGRTGRGTATYTKQHLVVMVVVVEVVGWVVGGGGGRVTTLSNKR